MTLAYVGSDTGPEAEPADPLACLRARADGYQPACGHLDHCPVCQLCADIHAPDCPERTTTVALAEKKCSVCGKFSWDSESGSYNETHVDENGKTVKCDTNGGTWVDGNPQ